MPKGKVLTVDAKNVFLQAMRMHFSSKILSDHMHKTWNNQGQELIRIPVRLGWPPTLVGSLVCESFAVELYLKCILCMEALPVPHVHGLSDLFAALPQIWKDKIKNVFDIEIKHPFYDDFKASPAFSDNLENCLSQATRAFEKWRYLFEADPPHTFLSAVRKSLFMAIIDARPDWEELARNLDIPPSSRVQLNPTPSDGPQETPVS